MKKWIIIILSTALLLACAGNRKADSTDNARDLGIQIKVTDGQQYGCDVVCWFGGFGFCYCVENAETKSYEIHLSDKLTASTVYSEDELLAIPRDSIGFCVYLSSKTTSYRIGFLRVLNKPHIWGYGTQFELLTEADPQAELLPTEPIYEYVWSNDGAYFSRINEDGSVLMYPSEFEENDVGFGEEKETKSEPLPVLITDESLIMICFFDSQRPGMLVSKERMLQLVRDGYFTEYPCWVRVSEGKLLAAMQINDR